MWLVRAVHRAYRVINPISRWVHSAGTGILALMMFLTATDVSLRYLFNRPILGSYELVEYMMAILVAFTIAYCALERGHVNIELLISRLPQRAQSVVNSFTGLISLGLFSLIAWRSFLQARILYFAGSTSSALHIPQFPFVIITSVGFGLLSLVVLIQFLESLSQAAGKWNHSP